MIKINMPEVMRLKNRLNNINNETGYILNNVIYEIDRIVSIVRSNVLLQSNQDLRYKISITSRDLKNSLDGLYLFMEQQLQSYSVTDEEARKALAALVALIDSVFDSNGNVVNTISQSKVFYSNATSDSGITDQSAYDSGESNFNYLQNKINNSDEKWNVINESYEFFKSKGLSDEQIAGILGNMAQESGFSLDVKNSRSSAQGLFQWLSGRHPESWDLNTQLEHAWTELSETRYNGTGLEKLMQKTTVDDATYSFAYWFEGYTGEMNQREKFADACYYYIKNNL